MRLSVMTSCRLFGLVVPLLCGCYHQYMGVAGSDPMTVPEEKTLHSYLWGLIHGQDSVAVCAHTKAIDKVEVKSNFGSSLVTVLTIGIVVPAKVKVYCAKPAERVDSIGMILPRSPGGGRP